MLLLRVAVVMAALFVVANAEDCGCRAGCPPGRILITPYPNCTGTCATCTNGLCCEDCSTRNRAGGDGTDCGQCLAGYYHATEPSSGTSVCAACTTCGPGQREEGSCTTSTTNTCLDVCNHGDTTGYNVAGCPEGSAEVDCTVTCDTNYGGTASNSCPSAGANFIFSGCDPVCTFAPSPGYDGSSCGGGPITEAACDVTCATGYKGVATDTCSTPGSTFVLDGCTRTVCASPPSAPGSGSVAFSDGDFHGSTATFSCQSQHERRGTAAVTCSAPADDGTWPEPPVTPECVPECFPRTTTGYDLSSCTADVIKTADVCFVTCEDGYGPSPTADCLSGGANMVLSGCTASSCEPGADPPNGVSCGVVQTGDDCPITCNDGYILTGSPQQCVGDSGASTSSLTGALQTCEPAECSMSAPANGFACTNVYVGDQCDVGCIANYVPVNPPTDCVAGSGPTAVYSGTPQECHPGCSHPADTEAYDVSNCEADPLGSDAECDLACASGYGGSPAHSCPSPGGVFAFSGCSPVCFKPIDAVVVAYYNLSMCPGTSPRTANSCPVSCNAGYVGSASLSCSGSLETFALSGCGPECRLPSSVPAGYDVSACSGVPSPPQCDVTCTTNYGGDAIAYCPPGGPTYQLGGCEPMCSLPTTTVGYEISCSANASSHLAADCNVSCSTGYSGGSAPTLTCATAGDSFDLSGCVPLCTNPDPVPAEYDLSGCPAGRGIPASLCSVTCAAGATGTAAAECPAPGEMVLSGCTASTTTGGTTGSTTGGPTGDCVDPGNGPNGIGCLNGGACNDVEPLDGYFECLCSTGFSGDNCETTDNAAGTGDSIVTEDTEAEEGGNSGVLAAITVLVILLVCVIVCLCAWLIYGQIKQEPEPEQCISCKRWLDPDAPFCPACKTPVTKGGAAKAMKTERRASVVQKSAPEVEMQAAPPPPPKSEEPAPPAAAAAALPPQGTFTVQGPDGTVLEVNPTEHAVLGRKSFGIEDSTVSRQHVVLLADVATGSIIAERRGANPSYFVQADKVQQAMQTNVQYRLFSGSEVFLVKSDDGVLSHRFVVKCPSDGAQRPPPATPAPAPAPTSRSCPACRSPLDPNAIFCFSCGLSLENQQQNGADNPNIQSMLPDLLSDATAKPGGRV